MPVIQTEIQVPTLQALPALDAALRLALGAAYDGVSTVKGTLSINLSSTATAEDSNSARQITFAHDYTTRTPEQAASVTRKANLDAIIGNQATNLLANLDTVAAAIASDLALIDSANQATVVQIVKRILNRQQQTVDVVGKLVKGIQRLAEVVG